MYWYAVDDLRQVDVSLRCLKSRIIEQNVSRTLKDLSLVYLAVRAYANLDLSGLGVVRNVDHVFRILQRSPAYKESFAERAGAIRIENWDDTLCTQVERVIAGGLIGRRSGKVRFPGSNIGVAPNEAEIFRAYRVAFGRGRRNKKGQDSYRLRESNAHNRRNECRIASLSAFIAVVKRPWLQRLSWKDNLIPTTVRVDVNGAFDGTRGPSLDVERIRSLRVLNGNNVGYVRRAYYRIKGRLGGALTREEKNAESG